MSTGETELVQELRALAGVKEGDSFEVLHDGVRVRVHYSGGSSSSLVLKVPYDESARDAPTGAGYRGHSGLAAIRPLGVTLRPESDTDRMAKESGMNVEFQTGDAAFDRSVYVDTRTPPEVLAHVLGEDARRAVTELFGLEFTSIVIDSMLREITATMISFPSLTRPEPTGARAVDAFARLARAMPRVQALAGTHASHPLGGANVLLGVLAAVTFFGGMPLYCGVIADGRCPNEMDTSEVATCLGPAIPGYVVGLVVAVVIGVLASRFTRRYRGRSDSAQYGSTFAWLAAVIAFSVTGALISWLLAGHR